MNMNLIILFCAAAIIPALNACNTENKEIHYHVYECQETENEALGNFVLKQSRTARFVKERDTCSRMPITFLTRNPSKVDSTNSHRVAGAFVYLYYTAPTKVFWGIEDTIKALKQERTLNLIVDGDVNFFNLQLKNKENNDIIEQFISSLDILELDKMPKEADVIHCENLFQYISRDVKNLNWSVTMSNASSSNAEYRFRAITGGLGGFYSRQQDDPKLWKEEDASQTKTLPELLLLNNDNQGALSCKSIDSRYWNRVHVSPGLQDLERNALRHCIPSETTYECFEENPCVAGVEEVIKSLPNLPLKYVVVAHNFNMVTTLTKDPSNATYGIHHITNDEQIKQLKGVISCHPFLDVLRLGGFNGAVYFINEGDPIYANFVASGMKIIARKEGANWDQQVADNYEVTIAHLNYEQDKKRQSKTITQKFSDFFRYFFRW